MALAICTDPTGSRKAALPSCWFTQFFFLSTKQNLLEELDGLQSDLTALKFKNEELKVSHQDYSQEVTCKMFVFCFGVLL